VTDVEEQAWLDWWANPSTLLGSVEVTVVVATDDSGWHVTGRVTHTSEVESFEFLRSLDPAFSLRFRDDSTFAVTVDAADDHRRFTLREDAGLPAGAVSYRMDL
jgi:hypothetical protein